MKWPGMDSNKMECWEKKVKWNTWNGLEQNGIAWNGNAWNGKD